VSRTQDNAQRDEQQKDHGNNVNVRYIWRQKDQHSGRYNSGHQINQDGWNLNGSAKGRVGENKTSRLNPTASHFNPQDVRPLAEEIVVVTVTAVTMPKI
jgi:hypothetical protein